MILLKANNELKNVFSRLIQTMGVNVVWAGNFVVLNNFLILSGKVRSLVFNFDNRKVNTNIIELPDKEEDMEPVADNEVLANVLNMTLYAFGKWGVIKGLKVEQNYNQLNDLFCAILKDLNISPGFRDDNFRFYKNDIQITYEEVVIAAIEEGKRKAEEVREETEEEAGSESHLGLWHKMRWTMVRTAFSKVETDAYERKASRLGNNFYLTGYLCPECQNKMHMCVYPQGQEFPVETEEGKVYLARSYTCDTCNLFYTPRPGKLLREGDVYTLKFDNDRDAYEDYHTLLGSRGARTTNYNFNEYASERGRKKAPSLEEACAGMEQMSEEELKNLEEKLEEGFFPPIQAEPYRGKVKELLRQRRGQKGRREKTQESGADTAGIDSQNRKTDKDILNYAHGKKNTDVRPKTAGDSQAKEAAEKSKGIAQTQRGEHDTGMASSGSRSVVNDGAADGHSVQNDKYDARMKVLDRMSLRQLKELINQIQTDMQLMQPEKEHYINQVKGAVYQKEEESVRKRAKDCADKPYGVINRVMKEISQADCPEIVKQEVLDSLREIRQKRGQEEAAKLIAGMPANINRNQYRIFKDKLAQYQDVDISAYQGQLDERWKLAAGEEIAGMLRRAARSNRSGLMNLLEQLKSDDFSEEQASFARKEIEDRIRALDEKAIDKICPNIMGMTFDEAAEAYEKIEAGAFLPELKTNTLEMIDKRLTKIKMDECGLLVEKLRKEIEGKIKDSERIHYYEVRSIMRGDWEPKEAELVANAMNTYAAGRGRYEYPIIVCDSSGRKNGKEGFVLTPEHIFYNSTFNSEAIPVRAVTKIEGSTGLLNRGLYVSRGGNKTKIPGGISAKELGTFGGILNKFTTYLQEKPESRSISYLAKEKHEVKCCYRCGYTYRQGDVCPKCGNRANQ